MAKKSLFDDLSTPFASILRHIQECIKDIEIVQRYTATLAREKPRDGFKLLFGDFYELKRHYESRKWH